MAMKEREPDPIGYDTSAHVKLGDPRDALAAGSKVPNGPCREKHWHECTDIEKTERVREALLQLEEAINFAGKTAVEAVQVAKLHEHGGKGNVLIPTQPEWVNAPYAAGYMNHVFRKLR